MDPKIIQKIFYICIMSEEELKKQIEKLESQLTGDMFHDMEIKDKIHNLTMVLRGVKPTDSHFDCIGCGS